MCGCMGVQRPEVDICFPLSPYTLAFEAGLAVDLELANRSRSAILVLGSLSS